ncbi:hypothetical protein GCM10009804_52080 [Kribbella hippodromi]|uniref:YacP-like NYN domain-containing protein n=1 Tax=Kribbella hippodromi TaxID=434347 RepID=A0ABN2DZ35_9ACTN
MVEVRGRVVVVDAANVVGSRPDGWWRDRVGAARRLLSRLVLLQEQLADVEIVVVLEGAARRAVAGEDAPEVGRVRVVLAEGSGDDTIVEVTRSAVTQTDRADDKTRSHHADSVGDTARPEGADLAGETARSDGADRAGDRARSDGADPVEVLVVTADRGLRERVEAVGAGTTGPRWLLEQLDGLPS